MLYGQIYSAIYQYNAIMRYITGAKHARSPPASPISVIKLECWMELDVCTPLAKLERKFLFLFHLVVFYGVVGSDTALNLVHLCFQ